MIGELESGVPAGPLADKWTNHKFEMKLVNPNNKRRFSIIVVGICGEALYSLYREVARR